MKVNFGVEIVPLSGYENLDKHPQAKLHYNGNLEDYIDHSIDVLNINNMLEFLHPSQVQAALQLWCSKVRKNGLLQLTGVEFYEVCRMGVHREKSIVELNSILFGDAINKRSVLSNFDLQQLLPQFGMKVIRRNLNGFNYFIEAEKQ